MTFRTRMIAFAAVVVLALGGASWYLASSHSKRKARLNSAPKPAETSLVDVATKPRIVFRNSSLGRDAGKVAMVTLAAPGGARATTETSCDRVYATAKQLLCLSIQRGVVTSYKAQLLDSMFRAQQDLPLLGSPSRARLSPDGTLAATTSFISGDSYAGTSFSTRTVVNRLRDNAHFDLETFRLIHNDATIRPLDRNIWGVTFAHDDNTFYATAAWGGHTWLVKGDLTVKTLTTLRSDAECPSLSPDEHHIVYKKRNGHAPGNWRLATLDLASDTETLLSETRSVDDQAEWLDDRHVLYGLPRTGSEAAIDDVWSVGIDGSASPTVLISQAWSPSVIRD